MKAKKGDKVIIIADGSYHTSYNKGEIWDVFNEGFECVYACKNGDEKNYTLLSDHEYETYKPKPALLFQIGDVVRIAPSSEYYCHTDSYNPKDVSGKIVEHKDGDYSVKWDNGNTNSYREEDLFHYVLDASCKNPAPISKPPIKSGDKVMCIKDCVNSVEGKVYINKGEILTNTMIYGDFVWFNEKPGSGNGNYPIACFEVYTGVEPLAQKPHEKIPIKVGDMVKVTKRHDANEATVGMIGRVIQADEKSAIKYLIETPNGNSWCVDAKHSSVVPTPKPCNYSVGDIVVITKTNVRAGGELGRIGKLTKIDTTDSYVPYRLEFSTGSYNWACEIRQATITEQLVYMSEKSERTHPMLVEKNPCMRVPIQSDRLHEPTENLEFQTPIIVKKPNKKRNLVIINN
jgi:hypothetical protein